GADMVACPGCFATAAQLSLLPLASFDPAIEFVAVDGKTGSSGAGVSPRETTHHPRRMNNFRAYKPLAHQHLPEIREGWQRAGGASDTPISFVPQMAPMVRGIFISSHLFASAPTMAGAVAERYAAFYDGSPFVRIVAGSPAVAEVWGTNRCDIATHADGRMIVVTAAIDNLIKGAAGQAVQCLNLMCGWSETTGLVTPPPSPV
ncbi:MAG: N-acetyl-gamma-glutamyl-phosphate reductase, partial [Deltaproteobacteria bacterium]|nr:N-acetyl-gamma-glutamyl-phosphate reductase [Deltaproteobacteria bacterium]